MKNSILNKFKFIRFLVALNLYMKKKTKKKKRNNTRQKKREEEEEAKIQRGE